MSPITTALSTLEATRGAIGEDAYAVIRAGLDAASDLRTAPGREATASSLVRGREEFRRQPHLELVLPGTPAPRPVTKTQQPPAPARKPARRPAPAEQPARSSRGMTLGH